MVLSFDTKTNSLTYIFGYLKDLTSFPDYMENVNSVVEHSDGDNSYVHEWEVVIEEAEFQWKQRSTVDRENRQVLFDLLEGDFDDMKGAWKVVDDPVQ